ncbi:unnamed protein product [Hermetia illucens]|uniref:Chitin-binding type-2 domain-containing protein n=1 Tax=Hermetia illucens TaxID=343691 RepID=A0A7R8UGL5_HERIL|nr:unnamed protein product [Hermetia illucens]
MKDFYLAIGLLFCICSFNLVASDTCNPPTTGCDTAAANAACTDTSVVCKIDDTSFLYCPKVANADQVWITANCLFGSTFDCNSKQCSGGSGPPTQPTTTLPSLPGTTAAPGAGTTLGPSVCYGQANGTKIAYPNSTNLYFLCTNGVASIWQCPSNGAFNQTTQKCQGGTGGGGTTNPGTVSCPSGVNTLLPAPNNCQYYYSCVNGVGTLIQCPNGYYFTPSMSACTINKPSNCGSGTSVISNYDPNNYFPVYGSNINYGSDYYEPNYYGSNYYGSNYYGSNYYGSNYYVPNYYPSYGVGYNYGSNYWRRRS